MELFWACSVVKGSVFVSVVASVVVIFVVMGSAVLNSGLTASDVFPTILVLVSLVLVAFVVVVFAITCVASPNASGVAGAVGGLSVITTLGTLSMSIAG